MTCAGWFVVTLEAGPTEEVGGDGRRLSERCRPDRWDPVQPERGGPFKSGAARDLGVIGVLVLLAALALIQFEPGEHLARSSLYESLELDEAPFLALIALAGLGAFAIRRWLEASRQARRAGEAAQALRSQDEERTVEAVRQRFERRLHSALDMAATESAALSVAERALEEGARGRPYGPCSATCAPVSVMGQTIGVLHTTGAVGSPPPDRVAVVLEQLAVRLGDRVGVLRAFERSEVQATTDPLTGLLNRRTLEDQVSVLLRRNIGMAVAYLDLDHCKRLNDTFGHEAGDRALRLFAKTLRDSARKEDLVSRWGGEEFLVVLPEATAAQAARFAERLHEELALRVTQSNTPPFTASAGASDSLDADRFEEIVLLADSALLAAKHAGRNRTVLASSLTGDAVTGPQGVAREVDHTG